MKDPIVEALEGAPNIQEVWNTLIRRLEKMPMDHVYLLAANLIIHGIRMSVPYRAPAEAIIDDLFARTKSATLAHYDATTGRKRPVDYPYTQLLQPSFHVNESQIFSPGGKKQ
jgi:hypothetical protein